MCSDLRERIKGLILIRLANPPATVPLSITVYISPKVSMTYHEAKHIFSPVNYLTIGKTGILILYRYPITRVKINRLEINLFLKTAYVMLGYTNKKMTLRRFVFQNSLGFFYLLIIVQNTRHACTGGSNTMHYVFEF